MRGFESCGDDFALDFLERAEAGSRARSARRGGAYTFQKILGLEEIAVASRRTVARTRENHRALERIAEFTDISGPRVGREHAARRIAQLRVWAVVDGANSREQMIGERQGIGAALTKRRNRATEKLEQEIKIYMKATGPPGGGEDAPMQGSPRLPRLH